MSENLSILKKAIWSESISPFEYQVGCITVW